MGKRVESMHSAEDHQDICTSFCVNKGKILGQEGIAIETKTASPAKFGHKVTDQRLKLMFARSRSIKNPETSKRGTKRTWHVGQTLFAEKPPSLNQTS